MSGNVYLCGPPGSGKSTVAPLLARLLDGDAIDLDAVVEETAGSSIARIVDTNGEAAFRALEREQVARVAKRRGAIVALGGGTLEDAVNRHAIAASGVTVFLDASLAMCARTTASQAGRRPLLREAGALARLHATRRARYREAAIRVAVDDLAAAAIAEAIADALHAERTIHVATAAPYDVAIGVDAIEKIALRASPDAGGRAVIVVDRELSALATRVARLYEDAGVETSTVHVDANEELKSLAGVGALYERFVDARLDRRGVVVGIGGGTIGDAAGFAAATFARGIRFIALPTTLLSAVDAAIGGKTAINLAAGKNLVGTVTQPAHVAIAPYVLRSLSARDVVSGYGEMLKYGIALDSGLYDALRAGEADLLADPATALAAIARCVAIKADIVARDPDDRTGERALLNFGHTFGHALEKVAGYGTLRHGEAVIVGMRAAVALSERRGHIGSDVRARLDDHLAALPVPPEWKKLDLGAVAEATNRDKKRHAGGTQFVVLDAIGRSSLDNGVSATDVRAALTEIGLR